MLTPRRTATLALGAASAWGAPAALAYAGAPGALLIGARRRLADRTRVALTFDDGPQPKATEAVLEQLRRLDATATFFVVGDQVRRAPMLLDAIAAEGHEVACHGSTHRNHLLRDPRGIADDIRAGRALIEDLLGRSVDMYRPPQGVVTPATLAAVRREGLALVLWSRWGRDWERRATPATITRRITDTLRGGDVLLLHDADTYARRRGAWQATVAALPDVVAAVEQAGLRPTCIGGATALA